MGSAGASRDRLEAIFGTVPAAIAVLHGPDHVFQQANTLYEQLVGRADLIGLPVREALPEIVGQGFISLLDGVYSSGEPYVGMELPVELDRRGDGQLDEAFVTVSYQPTRAEDGTIVGVLVYATEVTALVTARIRAEELAFDLERERARLETVIEQIPVGVIIANAAGQLTHTNRAWREIVGLEATVDSDLGVLDGLELQVLDGDSVSGEQLPLARALRDGDVTSGLQLHLRRSDGQERTLEASCAPISDADGQIFAAVTAVFDISERKRLEQELADRRATARLQGHLNEVFDAAGDGIWVLDMEGRITLINPAAQRMTGWTPEEIVGEVSHYRIHHSHADGSEYPIEQCPIYRSVFFGESCVVEDEVFWRKDGTSFPVAYRSTPLHVGTTQVGAVQTFRDLTLERQAAENERRLSEARLMQRTAYEINDTIVQRLAVADLAYGLGRPEQAAEAVRDALAVAKRIIDDWARDADANLTRLTIPTADGVRDGQL